MEQQFELRTTQGVGDQQQRKVMKPSKDLWIGSVQKKKVSAFGLPIILCSDSQISQGPKDFDQAAPRVNPHALDIKTSGNKCSMDQDSSHWSHGWRTLGHDLTRCVEGSAPAERSAR